MNFSFFSHYKEQNQLALFFLCEVYCGEKSTVSCVGYEVEHSKLFNG